MDGSTGNSYTFDTISKWKFAAISELIIMSNYKQITFKTIKTSKINLKPITEIDDNGTARIVAWKFECEITIIQNNYKEMFPALSVICRYGVTDFDMIFTMPTDQPGRKYVYIDVSTANPAIIKWSCVPQFDFSGIAPEMTFVATGLASIDLFLNESSIFTGDE